MARVSFPVIPIARFAVEGRAVIDCAVALHEGVFHLFAPDNGAGPNPAQAAANAPASARPREGLGYHAASNDGLEFKRLADVRLATSSHRWLGNVQSEGGKLVFFGTGPGPWPMTSPDGTKWRLAESAVRIPGADPGAVKLHDGSWLLLVTGAPRPGTPTAMQRE